MRLKKAYAITLTLAALTAGGTIATAGQTGPDERSSESRTPAPQEAPPEPKVVSRKNENLSVTFSGRVHRMLLGVDDGADTGGAFLTDSEQGPTMLRFDATGKPSESLSLGATIEVGIRQNRPFLVSQDSPDGGANVTVRMAEAHLDGKAGRFSFGRGFASGWLAPEMDLSGTQFASLLPVGMLAPGMKFVDASDGSLSDVQVLTHFVDVERLLLVDRLRYDSPRFGPGAQLSGSVGSDGRWDTAFRLKPGSIGSWTVVAGGSYQNEPFAGIDQRLDGVVSLRNEPTGLNLTVAGTRERLDSGRDANTYLVKAGWLADLVGIGRTAFSVDYYSTRDVRLAGDEGRSVGIFVVQKWPDYGLDIYAGVRRYEVDRPDIDLRDLDVLALGVALNF